MNARRQPNPDGSQPPTRMRKADRKRHLIAHANELFLTQGYHNTTTEKIAARSLRRFRSRPLIATSRATKALFLEILNDIRQATLLRWDSETATMADPLAKLHAIADMYLSTTREQATDFQIMHRALLDCDDRDVAGCLRTFYVENETFLARIIGEGQLSGVFRRTLDSRVGAWELIRTAVGYTLTLPLGIPLYQEPDYHQRAIECLLQSLVTV